MEPNDPYYPVVFLDGDGNANVRDGATIRLKFIETAMGGFLANTKNLYHFNPEDDAAYIVKIADATLKAAGVSDDLHE